MDFIKSAASLMSCRKRQLQSRSCYSDGIDAASPEQSDYHDIELPATFFSSVFPALEDTFRSPMYPQSEVFYSVRTVPRPILSSEDVREAAPSAELQQKHAWVGLQSPGTASTLTFPSFIASGTLETLNINITVFSNICTRPPWANFSSEELRLTDYVERQALDDRSMSKSLVLLLFEE